jgi:ketosteroid isomerase-like protein
MFDVPVPIQSTGLDAYRRTWEIFFASNDPGPGRFRLRDVNVVAGQDVAVAYALLDVADGAARCRLTVAFRREHEDWTMIHEHHSMPIS